MPIPPQILKRLSENDDKIVGLYLSHDVKSDGDVVQLVNALKGNTHLKKLTIQGQCDNKGITNRSVVLLRSCSHLVYLDLSYNKNITDSAAHVLACAKNMSLETLFLRGCSVTPAGLRVFLENDRLLDVRIADSASLNVQEGADIKAKLKDNAELKELPQKLTKLSVEELNSQFYCFINENPHAIQKLPEPLQLMAQQDPREWAESITLGLTLANNLSKLTGGGMRRVATFSLIYAEQYRVLYEQQKKLTLLFSSEPVQSRRKKRKEIDEAAQEAWHIFHPVSKK